jgi:CheY-like chemotaxis protein
LQPRTFDLNAVIADFEKMLRRLLGERIKIVVRPNSDACLVRADPTEIGRVLLNLCLNARDAMPTGGVLTIETAHVSLDERHAAQRDVPRGKYVRLVVADNGLGMDDETRRHAFEPFFTTKDLHQGSGLGLATTFGIVQQSGGSISCESELGRGTQFEVLLPVAAGTEGTEYRNGERTVIAKGSSEVVLLVEDDDAVRGLTKRVLELAGYVVLAAEDGRKGLSVLETHTGRIDILISDVLMPEMSGGALMERAMTLRPGLRVLFVSGYPEDVLVKEGVTKGTPFLQKPYAPGALARKVRDVLDA